MGGGNYSFDDRTERATTRGYHTKSVKEVLTNYEISNNMNPKDVMLRESRDSQEHPNSVAIVIGLDVTGSMEKVPEHIVRDGLPHIMDKIIQSGINDPQVLFVGIGDHECDEAPFQVGQFESSDELLDKWLTDIYLEGNGGGNDGESYLLAWYFAGHRTELDCLDKRGKKGFLFTIGDEPTLPSVDSTAMRRIFGGQHDNVYSDKALLDKAKEKYHVYHLHIMETRRGRMTHLSGWESLLGDKLITVQGYAAISKTISDIIVSNTSEPTGETLDPVQGAGVASGSEGSGYTPPGSGL